MPRPMTILLPFASVFCRRMLQPKKLSTRDVKSTDAVHPFSRKASQLQRSVLRSGKLTAHKKQRLVGNPVGTDWPRCPAIWGRPRRPDPRHDALNVTRGQAAVVPRQHAARGGPARRGRAACARARVRVWLRCPCPCSAHVDAFARALASGCAGTCTGSTMRWP